MTIFSWAQPVAKAGCILYSQKQPASGLFVYFLLFRQFLVKKAKLTDNRRALTGPGLTA